MGLDFFKDAKIENLNGAIGGFPELLFEFGEGASDEASSVQFIVYEKSDQFDAFERRRNPLIPR